MIKVVLWDIDGTLLNFLKAEKAGIHSCFEKFKLGECTDEMLADYMKINTGYWQALERGEMKKEEILVNRFRDFLGMYGLDTSVAEAFNAEYQIRLGDTIVFEDHAEETLLALKGHVLQCVVTNGTRIAQTRKLERSGMNKIFDHIFISEEIGIEKPNKGFFDHVFEEVGTFASDEVLIVGDSLTSDMLGGVNAGILTCWFNPHGAENTKGLPIDYVIRDVGQVLEIVGCN